MAHSSVTLNSWDTPIPIRLWSVLSTIAVVGSCLYGASLSLVIPTWQPAAAAAWLAVSAGLAWCIFIPSLCAITRLPCAIAVTSCLVAMGAGEVVLFSGAIANLLMHRLDVTDHATTINAIIVAISNVTMLGLLATDLRRRGVSVATTVSTWVLVLNGSGAGLFLVLFPLLHRA